MGTVAERVAASNPLYVNNPQGIKKRQDEVLSFYKSLSPVTAESLFQFVMENWRAIDLYSVSICFANIFLAYKLGESPSDQLSPLATLLLAGTSPDPRQRPTVGQLTVAARKAVSGGTEADIRALVSVRETAEANRRTAAVTLLGTERSLSRTSVRTV